MESYLVITAIHLTRSADLRLAQLDQREKTAGVGLGDSQMRTRLMELKAMAALAPIKTALVHLSCKDAQILAPVALPPEHKGNNVGDININVKSADPKEFVKAVSRLNRRLRS